MKIKFDLFRRKNSKCNEKNYIVENDKSYLNKKYAGYSYLKEFNLNKDYLDKSDFEPGNKGLLKKIDWIESSDKIKEIKSLKLEDEYTSEFKKNSLYYKSVYICPRCNSHMLYKIRAYNIDTKFNNKNKRTHHIYTCPKCRIFLASIRIYSKLHSRWIGNKLSNYALISDSYPRLKYRKILSYTEELHSE
ncbi:MULTISPECIES: hypothetical protein [Paraclostridium]|uniref:Uncharacterized protein n=1 Tax=Paraclostridium benzoelyticum TaxID=1629550 RepID=A0A0M3DIP8_9FIRM|nr:MULTISPECIES: hypothetical protein [Paraclostridium]KKY02440.1 hypothetical protein VN21_03155 [Paraclostridium benzoelyticum]MCU9814768.1 hypothetical protein [Paraclostridium sp. AKS73]OXX82638.1 hypothetical protein AVM15_17215 [Paraclostridium benzoelyticum]